MQLRDVIGIARDDGRVSHLEHVCIHGSHVRFFMIPDMLRNAPMFRNNKALKARGARGGVMGTIVAEFDGLELMRNVVEV